MSNGQLPPIDAVRIGEMVNYFQYELEGPSNGEPVVIHTKQALWNPKHHLLHIGLKANLHYSVVESFFIGVCPQFF